MGFFAESINAITLWITSALYGGYVASNFLKWIWWRFNGWGYFWGYDFWLNYCDYSVFIRHE
ncbi:predicted sodium-dependent mannose transporter [Algibacter lectus]|uniref:Predicted sodium-dependent mannose transporter n=1 Tax=Algibacter lectus TaxID=221126 RepID=A0A090WXL6_9FLAO|nr:predicted sodium-dependent mannose transporter [Algibacter lectus]